MSLVGYFWCTVIEAAVVIDLFGGSFLFIVHNKFLEHSLGRFGKKNGPSPVGQNDSVFRLAPDDVCKNHTAVVAAPLDSVDRMSVASAVLRARDIHGLDARVMTTAKKR